MEIISGGIDRFERIKRNAYWANVHLDTSLQPEFDDVNDYKAHLNDRIKNPTIGALADHKYISGKSHNYSFDFYQNKKIIDATPEIRKLKQDLTNKIQEFHSKSRKIREHIVASDRLDLDFVKKSKGYKLIIVS